MNRGNELYFARDALDYVRARFAIEGPQFSSRGEFFRLITLYLNTYPFPAGTTPEERELSLNIAQEGILDEFAAQNGGWRHV